MWPFDCTLAAKLLIVIESAGHKWEDSPTIVAIGRGFTVITNEAVSVLIPQELLLFKVNQHSLLN